jgi:MFS family permease
MNLANTLAVVAIGQVLTAMQFPLNYQVVFSASLMGGLIAFMAARSVELPHAPRQTVRVSPIAALRDLGRSLGGNQPFVRFTVSLFVLRFGLLLPLPLYAIYWVRHVEASDAAISLINSSRVAMTIVSYFVWTRASRRLSRRCMLLVNSLGISLYPLLTSLTHWPHLLAVWGGLDGFFAAGFNLAFFDVLMSTCPPGRETTYVGLHQTTVNIALFVAPLIGTSLSGAIGVAPTLLAGTVLGIIGVGLMLMLGAGKSEPVPVG